MHELVRIEAQRTVLSALPQVESNGLVVGLARSSDEIEDIQRLRYNVFTEEMGAVFPHAKDGIDRDRYDQWCEHLLVRELSTGRVVGTYRILTPEKALAAGGYYSESEFDLSALAPIRSGLVEVGRSCTHPDYRNGGVIMLLWTGVSQLLRAGGYRYVLGCASVSLRDDGVTAAQVWREVSSRRTEGEHLQVKPLHRYPFERLNSTLPARLPPLIKGYMKLGATVCGEPAWDPDFNAADFPVMLDILNMDPRYRRHLGLEYTPTKPAALQVVGGTGHVAPAGPGTTASNTAGTPASTTSSTTASHATGDTMRNSEARETARWTAAPDLVLTPRFSR